ncbi:MAG: twin-arginine translocase TatA/TatE family subunit [Crocinitomicaceae bacterium]|nr:twin-arginine translocase TatA/TatE family subunit [Crocinitomicaceae bacterium]|tara:strand:- start:16183 stop:16344 length:162 start_codon:yes stop_codon:yes gene_type:complete
MGKFSVPGLILILVVVLLLFGGKKIPELMKGIGKGVKEFKDGMNSDSDSDSKD